MDNMALFALLLFAVIIGVIISIIAISATKPESSSFLKQVSKAKKELDISRDEMMDVLKVVLLTSGMQPFNKALELVNKLYD